MAFQAVPNVCRVNVRATLLGEQMENVFHLVKTTPSPFTAAEVLQVADTTLAAWAANMLPNLGGNYVFREVVTAALDSDGAPTATSVPGTPPSGGAAGEALPAQNALVITHRTGLTGRSFRGRTYIGGLTESQTSGNNVTAAAGDAIADAFALVKGAWVTEGWDLVVVSRYANKVARPTGIFTRVLASVIRDYQMDRRSSRMP